MVAQPSAAMIHGLVDSTRSQDGLDGRAVFPLVLAMKTAQQIATPDRSRFLYALEHLRLFPLGQGFVQTLP